MLSPPDFKIGSDTQLILSLMEERVNSTDTLVTFHEMQRLTGKSKLSIMGAINTARRHIRADHGKFYANVRNIGYRVMADEDLPSVGKSNRGRARNLHRETIKTLAIADPAKQSAQAKTRTVLERSIAELGLAATAPRAISKAEQMVSRSHNELTSEEQIEAIKDALRPKK